MELSLLEPSSSRYIYINPQTNRVHLLVPLVGGQEISTDNTCKTDIAINKFNDTALQELKKYQALLEFDLSVLPDESPVKQQKQSRLQQINDYIALVSKKKGNFISLREEILKKPSNLYGILLRPRVQDSQTKVQNPIFSLNRKNNFLGNPLSLLFNSLHSHLRNIKFAKPSPKQQLLDAVVADLENKDAILSTNERLVALQQKLTEKANALFNTTIDFTKASDGTKIDIDYLNAIFDVNLTEQEALDGLLGACAQDFFDTYPESPFYAASRERPEAQLEKLSIMTQFFLATINIYCMSHGLTKVNFGAIFDGNQALSDELTQIIKQSLEKGEDVENNICRFIEKHRAYFKLPQYTRLNTQQIKEKFSRTYLTVKDSPHMDEFMLLDLEAPIEKSIFVTHQGSICTDITLLVQEQELTETLSLNKLDFIASHPNEAPAQNPSVSATDKLDIPLEPLLETLANQNVNFNQYSGLIENITEALFHACIENSLENPSQAYSNFCKIISRQTFFDGIRPVRISNPPTILDLCSALSVHNKTSVITKITTQIAQLEPEKQLELLQQKNSHGETLLNFFLLQASQSLEPLLPVIEKMDKKLVFSILNTLDSLHKNALMIAATDEAEGVKHLLKLIAKLEQEEKYAIFSQTSNWWGCSYYNPLMLAARYQPQAVEPILKALQELSQDQIFAIFSKTFRGGNNALMDAARYHPQAVKPILKAMQELSPDQKFALLSKNDHVGWNVLMIAARNHPQAVEPILKAMQELSPEQKFTILSQTTDYDSNALMFAARFNPQAVEPILKAMQELSPEQKFKILSQGSDNFIYITPYCPQHVELILKSLSQLPTHYQYQYFRKNPLNKLQQLFAIESISPNPIVMSFLKLNAYRPKAKDLKTQAAVAKIEQLSQMYQQEKDLIPSDINQYLRQIQLIKIKHKDLDARLLKPLKNLEQSLIQRRQAQISWPHEEPFNETNIDSISSEWLKAHASEFKVIFQQLSPDWQNKLLEKCYGDLSREDYQSIYNHLSIDIPGAKSSSSKHSLFQPQPQELIPPENDTLLKEATRLKSRPDFYSLNMAIDLERLAFGMSFYRNQLTSALPMHEKQKIHQESKKFFYHYLDKIQEFKTKHPRKLQISMHSIEELEPIIPFEESQKTKSPSPHSSILLEALKTNNQEKISDAVEKVYQLSNVERLPILLACHNKLTSFIKDNPAKLYLLELERVKYQLQINNPHDPNIKVFGLLLLQLRANPENALDYLTEAQVNIYRNLTWWQIVTGYFNGTGYGIGLLKNSLDNLLEKINENISVPAGLRNSNR